MSYNPKLNHDSATVKAIEQELENLPEQVGSPFRNWLYSIKRLPPPYGPNGISVALWAEWQAAKPAYLADCKAVADARRAQSEALAKAKADASRDQTIREEAANKWADGKIAQMQAYQFKPLKAEPLDWERLHDLKKDPKARQKLIVEWVRVFNTKSENLREAWSALHSVASVDVGGSVVVENEDGESTAAPTAGELVFFNELQPGERDLYRENIRMVLRGLAEPDYHAFRQYTVNLLDRLNKLGNPLESIIMPPADSYQADAPAEDVDALPDNPEVRRHVVPGLVPRGWTIPHGDASAGKSIWMIKLGLAVSDLNGATFEGIEVDHGQVIFSTQDPQASRDEVRPDVLEIRARLGLNPSGRFHLTDSRLVLNEPASVQHWIELNKARLPAKLIVVDSLFSAVIGSLAQDTVVKDVCDGVSTLLRHADAVVTTHHDNKSGDIFGSVYTTPMLGGKMAVTRSALKDGRPGGHVTVAVERIKRPESLSGNIRPDYKVFGA